MSNENVSLTFKSATTHQYINNKSLYYELFNSTQDTNKEYIETKQENTGSTNRSLPERCQTVYEQLLEMTKNPENPLPTETITTLTTE
ncbi:hypothetical protein ACO0QE_004026 [Hanseniaspora vineae]